MLAKTPLRYPGGKARALKMILPLVPIFSEYREPFLGGASIFIALKQTHPNVLFKINDLNYDVYCFWKTLKGNPQEFVRAISLIKAKNLDGRLLYKSLSKSKTRGTFARALRFYVLNRISYSGTVDSGGYSDEAFHKRFTEKRIRSLQSLAELLNGVEISYSDYKPLLMEKGKEVFIFLDPPYWNARSSSLYGQNGDLNRHFDHEELAEQLRTCQHKWLMTCDDSDRVRDLFSFAQIYSWKMKYNGLRKKQAVWGKELFITNYKPENWH